MTAGFGVVMAGGRGTRFWPLSRAARPKQLLPLASSRSLVRDTCERLFPLLGPQRLIVVTNAAQAAAVAAELPELPAGHVVAEPIGRNTAACAALGAMIAERLAGSGPVALVPADHCIPDPDAFRAQLAAALAHAGRTREAVTFGVPPARPETGYGYIETGPAEGPGAPLRGIRFVEKPDAATAARYVAEGRYLWNSGIFVWESRALTAAFEAHLPGLWERVAPAGAAFGTAGFTAALAAAYTACPSVSIDVAVMEKLPRFAVFRAAFRWSDLGSWDAWGELAPELPGGNRGAAELYPVDAAGNVVHAPGKAVALIGVEGLVVVDAGDALLVCRGRDAQRIREVTALLEQEQRSDLL
jgi:mannose-1-phosphate guanylyltransferase